MSVWTPGVGPSCSVGTHPNVQGFLTEASCSGGCCGSPSLLSGSIEGVFGGVSHAACNHPSPPWGGFTDVNVRPHDRDRLVVLVSPI